MKIDCSTCLYDLLGNDCGCFGCVQYSNHRPRPPITNADRIRGMSDEELARFLWEQNGGNRYWKSVGKYLDWLKQPAKEELI